MLLGYFHPVGKIKHITWRKHSPNRSQAPNPCFFSKSESTCAILHPSESDQAFLGWLIHLNYNTPGTLCWCTRFLTDGRENALHISSTEGKTRLFPSSFYAIQREWKISCHMFQSCISRKYDSRRTFPFPNYDSSLTSHVPGSKLLILGMVIPPLVGNPYNRYRKPYYWVDDHPLLYGNNGSLDPAHINTHPIHWRRTSQFLGSLCKSNRREKAAKNLFQKKFLGHLLKGQRAKKNAWQHVHQQKQRSWIDPHKKTSHQK